VLRRRRATGGITIHWRSSIISENDK